MSLEQRAEVERAYHAKQWLDEQLRMNKLLEKQNAQKAKEQKKILSHERSRLKEEQERNNIELEDLKS